MTEDDVRKIVKQYAVKAGGVRALARELGISPSYVSDVLLGRRAPGPPFLDRVGIDKVVTVVYRRRP